MPSLRSRTSWAGAAVLGTLVLGGCQAILGIDDTTFHESSGSDASTDASGDAAIGDSGPVDSGSDSHVDIDAGTALVSISPSRVLLRQGGTVDLTVTVTRSGFAGPVTVALADVGDAGVTSDGGPDGGGADGIGAPTLTIPAGQNSGTLHLSAAATTAVGLTSATFDVTTATSSSASIPVMIGGPTGTLDTTFGTGGAVTDQAGDTFFHVVVGPDDSPWIMGGGWNVRHYSAAGVADNATNSAIASALADLSPGSGARLAVRGTSLVVGGQENGAFVVRMLSTSGVLDTSFAQSGTFHATVGSNFTAAGTLGGLAFASNGDVLAAGVINSASTTFCAFYRVARTGSGKSELRFTNAFSPTGIGVDALGNIAAGGMFTTADAGTIFFGAAITGNLDDASTGYLGSPHDSYFTNKSVVWSGSKVFVAGGTAGTNLPQSSFGSFDTVDASPIDYKLASHDGTWDQGYNSISIEADGHVLVTGINGGSQSRTAYVRRMNADGSSPSTIYFKSDQGGAPDADFYDTASDSWGRIYVVGHVDTIGAYLVRVWP